MAQVLSYFFIIYKFWQSEIPKWYCVILSSVSPLLKLYILHLPNVFASHVQVFVALQILFLSHLQICQKPEKEQKNQHIISYYKSDETSFSSKFMPCSLPAVSPPQ